MPANSDTFRFVILEHDHPYLHWDLLLESGESLDAWRLLERPTLNCWLPAESLPAHRTLYLDYEGPVSNNRGSVIRIQAGRFRKQSWSGDEGVLALSDNTFATTAQYRCSASRAEWRFS